MVKLFRSQRVQQNLLLAVTSVIIISFVIGYASFDWLPNRRGAESFGKIYGRNVSIAENRSIRRQFEAVRGLGMFDLAIPLASKPGTFQFDPERYVWNTIILRHEAKALGIIPTNNQIVEAITQLPIFKSQKDGRYDHAQYKNIMAELAARGISKPQFEEIISDSIRLQAIRSAIDSASEPSTDELTAEWQKRHQKVEASLIHFSQEEIGKNVAISDADIQKAFDARKDSLTSPEKRKVQAVCFPLPSNAQAEPESVQKLADQAIDFAGALLEPKADFEAVAKKFGLELKTSDFFASGDRVEALGAQPRASIEAFKLTPEKPFSEAIGTMKGYFILHLIGTEPARPLTFEEAKPKLAETLRTEQIREKTNLQAASAHALLDAALKAGKTFTDAAKEAGFKVETPEPFSSSEPKLSGPNASTIQSTASNLKDGQLSSPVETANGSLLVYVARRVPMQPGELDQKKAEMIPMLKTNRTDGILSDWIEQKQSEARIEMPNVR